MPKPTRLPIVLAAALLGACTAPGVPSGSSEPSGAPQPSASIASTSVPASAPAAQPTAGTTPVPSPTALAIDPLPPENCARPRDIEPASPEVTVTADVGRFGIDMALTEVTDPERIGVPYVPPARELHNDGAGLVIGGHSFRTRPENYHRFYLPPIEITAASAILRLEGAAPISLPMRFVPGNENFNQAEFDVPDVAGTGELEMTLQWHERCFAFTATGTTRVVVLPTAATDGCTMVDDEFDAELGAVLDDGLSVGGGAFLLVSPFHRARYLPHANPGIDAFLQYLFDPAVEPLPVAPDSLLHVAASHPDLDLGEMETWTWTRKSVAAAVAEYPPLPVVQVGHGTPAARDDGSYRVRVPDEPGRYVVAIEADYETPCATGTAWSMVPVTVTDAAP